MLHTVFLRVLGLLCRPSLFSVDHRFFGLGLPEGGVVGGEVFIIEGGVSVIGGTSIRGRGEGASAVRRAGACGRRVWRRRGCYRGGIHGVGGPRGQR